MSFLKYYLLALIIFFSLQHKSNSQCQAIFEYELDDGVLSLYDFSGENVAERIWTINGYFAGDEEVLSFYVADELYDVCLNIITFENCNDLSCKKINISSIDCKADFNYKIDSFTITCNNTSNLNDFTQVKWYVDNRYISNSATEIYFEFIEAGEHTVCLEIHTENCIDTFCQTIIIPEQNSPQAFFTKTDTIICKDEEVAFTNLSENAVSYYWDFGDGNYSEKISPYHTYNQRGKYKISLTAFNSEQKTNVFTDSILVINKPIANFSNSGFLTQTFTNNSDDANYFKWDFGDGNYSTEVSPIHTYENTGTYSVKLLAGNKFCETTIIKEIKVDAATGNIVANFSMDITGGCSPLSISFTNISENAVLYHWDFGDGAFSEIASPQHTYTESGKYYINLTAYNENEELDIHTDSIFVLNKPTADFSASGFLTQTFTNNSTDATYYRWEFGDGTSSTETSPIHTYSKAGVYNVKLLSGNKFCVDTIIKEIKVDSTTGNVIADFSTNVTSGCSPLSVSFTNLSENAISYNWDFGDGTSSSETNPTHTFNTAGNFQVKLTAYHSSGMFFSEKEIIINAYATPIPDFEYSINDLEVKFINKTDNTRNDFFWNFGDENTSTQISPTHNYSQEGTYTVNLEAILNNCKSNISKNIELKKPTNYQIISGKIYSKNKFLKSGAVLLYKKEENTTQAIQIQSVENGKYHFAVEEGKYIIYAVPNISSNKNNDFPTYSGDVLCWKNAYIVEAKGNIFDLDIHLFSNKNRNIGNNEISGKIKVSDKNSYEKNVFGKNWFNLKENKNTNLDNNLAQNIPVILYDKNNTALNWILSDENGAFKFSSLNSDIYTLIGEKAGFEMQNESQIYLLNNNNQQKYFDLQINSDNISFNFTENNSEITLQPNPVKSYFYLQFTTEETSNIKIDILDLSGRNIKSKQIKRSKGIQLVRISCNDLKQGFYIVSISINNKTKNAIKFFKQ